MPIVSGGNLTNGNVSVIDIVELNSCVLNNRKKYYYFIKKKFKNFRKLKNIERFTIEKWNLIELDYL